MSSINFKDDKGLDSGFSVALRLFNEHIKSKLRYVGFAVVCMMIVAITTAINAWMMQPVMDDIFLKQNHKMLYIIPIGIIVNSVVKCIATFYQQTTLKMIGQNILTEIQLKLYSHLIYQDMKFLNEYPSGNLISRFTNDISAMRKTVTDTISGLIVDLFTIIGLLGVMLYQNTKLTIIAFIVFPIAIYPLKILAKKMKKITRAIQEELAKFTIRLDETFQNIKVIKSYCRETYEISRARAIIERFLKMYKKAAIIESTTSPIMETLGSIAISLVIIYGGSQVISGVTTPGSFFSFIASLLMMYKPLKTISNLSTSLQEGLTASQRLFHIIDEGIVKEECHASEPSTKFDSHEIRFNNVDFSYRLGKKIIDEINIVIPEGKTVAFVGTSGAGKTTIFNLLQKLYESDQGTITIGGKNIKAINSGDIRSLIGLVDQEVNLFDDTIKENIRYGKLDATDEEIVDAAMKAAAHEFIITLPLGYDTPVGQKATKLSGGQKQRIAIARAILKDAPILLLDEATSALDLKSEYKIQMALEYLKEGRTTIIIAHRLSTIEKADIIYVFSLGKIKEFGTHDALISKHGEYYRLYNKYYN